MFDKWEKVKVKLNIENIFSDVFFHIDRRDVSKILLESLSHF